MDIRHHYETKVYLLDDDMGKKKVRKKNKKAKEIINKVSEGKEL